MKWKQKKSKLTINKGDSPLEKIAKTRGIAVNKIDRFLSPANDELHDPYLMKNIEEASNRIIRAIKGDEKIVVSYDCDMDGISSATIMRRYLNNYSDNVDFIYGERSSGHGIESQISLKSLDKEKNAERIELNKENVRKIKEASLLIIVDSSSNDAKACEFISKELNTDIVVLDHHQIDRDNLHVIMVNPQQGDCKYPNKHLSGAGVVFKTIQVIEDTLEEVDVWQYSDLVSVGMYADMMRVDVFENRYLILNGLRNIKNMGLTRILKSGKVDFYRINCEAIGFTIAPLINSTCRMGNIILAIEMLMEDEDKACQKIQRGMKKLNKQRKEKQKELTDSYMKKADINKKAIMVFDEHSNKGLNGLISQQLSSRFKRPTIVGRIHKGTISGSCRSYGGFDMQSFLTETGYVEAIGHKEAFGISFPEEKLKELIMYIEENLPSLSDKEQAIIYDLEIDIKEVLTFMKSIERFNVLSGNGFEKVIIKVNNIMISEVKCIGVTQETIKIGTLDNLELIKFKVNGNYANDIGYYDCVSVVGSLSMNEWFNFATKKKISIPQVIIDDYRVGS